MSEQEKRRTGCGWRLLMAVKWAFFSVGVLVCLAYLVLAGMILWDGDFKLEPVETVKELAVTPLMVDEMEDFWKIRITDGVRWEAFTDVFINHRTLQIRMTLPADDLPQVFPPEEFTWQDSPHPMIREEPPQWEGYAKAFFPKDETPPPQGPPVRYATKDLHHPQSWLTVQVPAEVPPGERVEVKILWRKWSR